MTMLLKLKQIWMLDVMTVAEIKANLDVFFLIIKIPSLFMTQHSCASCVELRCPPSLRTSVLAFDSLTSIFISHFISHFLSPVGQSHSLSTQLFYKSS